MGVDAGIIGELYRLPDGRLVRALSPFAGEAARPPKLQRIRWLILALPWTLWLVLDISGAGSWFFSERDWLRAEIVILLSMSTLILQRMFADIDFAFAEILRSRELLAEKISEARERQAALEKSEEKFRKTFSASPDSFVIARLADDRIIEVNDEFIRLTGFSRNEALGRNLAELGLWDDPADRERSREAVLAAGRARNLVFRFRTKAGEIRHGLFSSELIELNGETHQLALIRDITEMKRMQEKLVEAERYATIGQLAAGVAHEFNNIMTVPSMLAELLLMEQEAGRLSLPDQFLPRVRDVLTMAERGNRIVSTLHSLANPGAEHSAAVNVDDFLRLVVREQQAVMAAEKARLELNLTADRACLADPRHLHQIFQNLLVNARHALAPKHGGTIRIASRAAGGRVIVTVEDDGIGMAEEVRKKIFTPFFTTKGAYAKDLLGLAGTGLGLPLVERLVTQLGGRIDVTSRVGEGSTFLVTLPAVATEAGAARSDEGVTAEWSRPGAVLIVDDEETVRAGLRGLLTNLGAREVLTAASRVEAVRMLATEGTRLALLLLDWSMPDGRGGEVLAWFRANPVIRPPVILLIGRGEMPEDEDIHELKAVRLIKPFTLEELKRAIRAATG